MEQHNASIKDNWVDQLATHGIFDLSVTEGKRLRDIRSGKKQQSLFTGNTNLLTTPSATTPRTSRRTQLLALRENDLFLAVGSTIRVLNLAEFKDAWVGMTERLFDSDLTETDVLALLNMPHKLLETPGIDFDIDVIIPNQKGSLLAVAGEYRIAVVCLPRKGFSSQLDASIAVVSHQKVSCKTLVIGERFYSDKSRVLQMAWHSLSQTESHLVVLSSESVLCMFDVATNIDTPEQVFDLAATQRKQSATTTPSRHFGISADDEMEENEEVASFDLGGISSDTSKWEPFTVYYALKNGHIYALCPVLPYKSTVRRQHLESLACVARAKCNDLLNNTGNGDEPNPYYYYFALQFEWIKDMLESAKSTLLSTNAMVDNNQLCIQSNKTSIPLQVQPQGPFVVKNTSQRTQSAADSQVSDMVLLRSRGLNFIALAFTSGFIENYLLAGGVGAQWAALTGKTPRHQWQKDLSRLQSSVAFLPRASLYEAIDVGKPQLMNSPIWLTKDPNYTDIYYAYHAGGIHSISTKKVLDHLLDMKDQLGATKDSSSQAMASFKEKQVTSELKSLVNTCPFESGSLDPIIGMVVFSDTYLSYCLLSLDANYRMIGIDMNLRDAITQSMELKATTSNKEHNTDTPTALSSYQSLLSQSSFGALDTLQKLMTDSGASKVVVPPEFGGSKEVIINKTTLNFLTTTATTIRKDITAITKCVSQLTDRLMVQRQEYERQISTLANLHNRASSFNSVDDSIESAQKAHAQLALRIDRMLKTLSNANQLGLSHKEQEWVDKINAMADNVSDYSARVDKLDKQIKSHKAHQYQPKHHLQSRRMEGSLSVSQASSIKNTLNLQKPALDDIKQRMENLNVEDLEV